MPYFSDIKRCIAPDLIGMGDSDKLDSNNVGDYNFFTHQKWLNDILESLNLGNKIILVVHDWGSALGFDWAFRNIDRIAGIVYMEGIVSELNWDDWDQKSAPLFKAFRSEVGENMVIEKNIFVERVLPGSVLRGLTEEEMKVYRRPFLNKEDRRPTLDWPNQIPIEGSPKEVVKVVNNYSKFFMKNDIPKLFINADPGAILIGKQREFCRSWPNQSEITVPGSHFIQEDSPDLIGEGILNWLNIKKL
jgi:haloalkane dehalogenase